MKDLRHNARIIVLQKLFEVTFPEIDPNQSKVNEFSLENIKDIDGINHYDDDLAKKLFVGVKEYYQRIDALIAKLAPAWPVEKIAKIDLQILRIAILEGFIFKLTPEKVAIDEAIELAKEFSNEQSRKFISGVLGNLLSNSQQYAVDLANE